MDKPQKITVYGAHWCPDCRRSKQFLGEGAAVALMIREYSKSH